MMFGSGYPGILNGNYLVSGRTIDLSVRSYAPPNWININVWSWARRQSQYHSTTRHWKATRWGALMGREPLRFAQRIDWGMEGNDLASEQKAYLAITIAGSLLTESECQQWSSCARDRLGNAGVRRWKSCIDLLEYLADARAHRRQNEYGSSADQDQQQRILNDILPLLILQKLFNHN